MSVVRLSRVERSGIVQEANLAPSVHNTQPSRWRFDGGTIEIYADPKRFLAVGDRELRDASLSCGAAVEGTVLALRSRNLGVSGVNDVWSQNQTEKGLRLAARIHISGNADPDPLGSWIDKRFTWRGGFSPVAEPTRHALIQWASGCDNVTLVHDRNEIKWIAELNDKTSLGYLADKPYREELVSWMRFSQKDKRWNTDGLNAEAMQLSKFEALAAKLGLSSPGFEIALTLKLAGLMVSEKTKTQSASGVVFFHVHTACAPLEIGRQFYRLWLHLTKIGLVAWPMAAIADNETSNLKCQTRFNLPEDHRLVNVFRVGYAPDAAKRPVTARIQSDELIID